MRTCSEDHAEIVYDDEARDGNGYLIPCPMCDLISRLAAAPVLVAEVERLTAALESAAAHHEDQARAWDGVEDDGNEAYHAGRARVLREALKGDARG